MKALWKGSLSFGLLDIAVELHPAVRTHRLGFRLLCKKCHTPIIYKDWCKRCKEFIAWEHVVKGLKISKNNYFIITPHKLKELRPHTTRTIEIKEFIAQDQLKPLYLDHHYYLNPPASPTRSYYLFKKALEDTQKIAIAQFVMRDKEYVCAINSYNSVLLLSSLNYAYEITPPSSPAQPIHPLKFAKQELHLAHQLIHHMSPETFNLDAYKNTFVEGLVEILKKSKKGLHYLEQEKKQEKKRAKKEKQENLVPLLQKSIKTPLLAGHAMVYDSEHIPQRNKG